MQHANIVQIFDVLELDDDAPVIVMELLEGESLAQRLAREGTLTVGDACRILLPVVAAISAAHAAGIVHRDLKPDNVFLARAPDGEVVVKVLDFGIAKVAAASIESTADTLGAAGTLVYMAPEQALAEKDIDARADVRRRSASSSRELVIGRSRRRSRTRSAASCRRSSPAISRRSPTSCPALRRT